MSEIQKMNLASENLVDDRLDKLKELMPEVFTESGIDFDKLRLELGDEVDEGQERYAFTWPGKADAIRQSQTVSTATLRPCVEKSRGRDGEDGSFDTDNIYIEGDNLEVLKLLQRGYHGKVKMIYIDPPYNTGHDFVYKDKFGDTIENYKKQAGLASQSNADTSGRFHSDWCSMMYPRLKLARELLSDDGLIFISINDVEIANLKQICNELFGLNNFVADLIWTNKEGGGSSDSRLFRIKHEHILCYARNIENVDIVGDAVSNIDRYKCRDSHFEERGPYYLQKLGMGSIQYSASLDYPIVCPDGSTVRPADNNHGKKACWRWSRDKIKWGLDAGFILFKQDSEGNWTVYTKQYLNCDNEGNAIERTQRPLGVIDKYSSTQASKLLDNLGLGRSFSYSKPVELLTYVLSKVNNPDIILDFFSGSGTLAHAAMKLSAETGHSTSTILVQLPEQLPENTQFSVGAKYENNLCDIGEERIRRAGDKIKAELDESNRQLKLGEEPRQLPDIGFRVFALDDSGIERLEPGQLVLDVVKPDRSELDIVFEMMLKWGLELTLPVEKSDAAGYPIWSVACDELVCCMSRGLTIEALEAIADMGPRRVLILDSILDDTLKLNAVQIFKHAGERMGCEIELRTV